VYRPDEQFKYSLTPVGTAVFDGWSLEELVKANPQMAADHTAEKDRADKEFAVVYANISKQQKINDAFKELQKAENARDQSPSAYQSARTAYYTLVKGDTWIDEERERISKAEVAPEVQKYRDSVAAVNVRTQEQQKTIDVVNGIKDKVLSLKDDVKYSVNTFSDQLEKVKIQLNMENRSRMQEEKDSTWTWVNLGLNVLLVAILLYAVYTFVRRYFLTRHTGAPMTTIRIPTYTGQAV
jgi:DNA-directed RNA polymerase alpha subunit